MPLFDLFWSMMWFFLWVAWIWAVIVVLGDIFRGDISGFSKALWVLLVIVVPWLGVFAYLIVHGDDLTQRRYDYPAARY